MFNCSFDSCQLYNGLLLGVIASLISSIIVIRFEKNRRRKKDKTKYNYLEGNYDGFGFKKDDLTLIDPEQQSTAKVNYLKDNKLEITVTHNSGDNEQRTWSGIIIMELETYGSIVWRYHPEQENEFNFGLKRCIVKREKGKVFLLLIGESLMDGTYKEQFDGKTEEVIRKIFRPNKELFIKK